MFQNRVDQQLVIGDHSIEVVDSFVYLGSCITDDNNEHKEIQRRLMLDNKAHFSLVAVMRSGDIRRTTKIMLYKTLIRSVLMYGCETRVLPRKLENALRAFKRKILRRIFGPGNDNGRWRIRHNHEMYELCKEPDLVTGIKIRRLCGQGHSEDGKFKGP
jgi:ribosomal protein S21